MDKYPKHIARHVVTCPHCGADALDHMTACPQCGGALTPRGDPGSEDNVRRIRRLSNLAGIPVIVGVLLWLLLRK